MKNTYFLFLCCCPLFLFGQSQQHFFSGHLSAGTGYYVVNRDFALIGTLNYPEQTLGVEWNYNYEFRRKWRLLAGVAYTRRSSTTYIDELRFGSEFNPQTGTFENDPSLPNSVTYTQNRHFVELPIGLKWMLVKRKCHFFMALGLEGNIFFGAYQKQVLGFEDGSTETTKTFNFPISDTFSNSSLNGGSIVKVASFFRFGLDVPIFKTKRLLIEPRLKYTRLDWFTPLSIFGFKHELVNADVVLGFQF